MNITGEATSSTAGCIPSSSATTHRISTESCPKDNSVAIGAGVGVSLGVLFFVAVATAWWYRRKWLGSRRERLILDRRGNKQEYATPGSTQYSEMMYGQSPVELRADREHAELAAKHAALASERS